MADRRPGGAHVFIWSRDAASSSFDELLWTFADRSFVPHESFSDARNGTYTGTARRGRGRRSRTSCC